MPMQDLTLMSAMLTKLNWMEERQKVLGQNIANADTPNYQPQDVKTPDFKSMLKNSASPASLASTALAVTDPKHMSAGGTSGSSATMPLTRQKFTYETSPSGNAVVLEEQLMKMSQNYTDYQFTANLYHKNMQMLKSAVK
jgi:flagellar basal-body rod protein FlgB